MCEAASKSRLHSISNVDSHTSRKHFRCRLLNIIFLLQTHHFFLRKILGRELNFDFEGLDFLDISAAFERIDTLSSHFMLSLLFFFLFILNPWALDIVFEIYFSHGLRFCFTNFCGIDY